MLTANRSFLEADTTDGRVMNIGNLEADVEYMRANIQKTNKFINYEPTAIIRERVGEFINWYEANRDWYKPLVR